MSTPNRTNDHPVVDLSQQLRYDWSLPEIEALYRLPLSELIFRAQSIHRACHRNDEVQACALLSIKTGACPEDCAYCPQSAHYDTGLKATPLTTVGDALARARNAKASGATRFCLGAAWRDVPNGSSFDQVLEMVRAIRSLGMEACCTLGMLTDEQADALGEAGLTAYNHNLDTSPEFYSKIITTRTYRDRLETLARVRQAGITVCCGGIIGMGESRRDRFSLLQQLSNLRPHPESVPINLLVRVKGTPLANEEPLNAFELVRTIATARILMPASLVRLSAGRLELSDEAQALCFVAGANSIFIGEQLLTTPNPEQSKDLGLLVKLNMRLRPLKASQDSQVLQDAEGERGHTVLAVTEALEGLKRQRPVKNDLLDSLHTYFGNEA
jgi:biotin synthase